MDINNIEELEKAICNLEEEIEELRKSMLEKELVLYDLSDEIEEEE